MSSFGQISHKKVWEMLKECLPDHKVKEYTHFFCIMGNGQTYHSLPKKSQIDKGHIKKMARHLGISDCAANHLAL